MVKRKYSPISFRVEVAESFRRLAQDVQLENTEALQVVMAAYDIINSTRYSGSFGEAVEQAFTEARQSD